MSKLKDMFKDILSWKRKYRDVYYLDIGENIYIFRTLTRGEYFDILTLQKSIPDIDSDYILELCLLYPSNVSELNNRLAGEVQYIEQCISELSGFSNGDKLLDDLEKAREDINIVDGQIGLLICKAFPHITLDKINQLNYNEILKYIALSESILEVKLSIEKPNDNSAIDFAQDNKGIAAGGNTPPF